MEELVKMVAERVGLSEDMAQGAVETVLEFLKERLPGPVAAQLDSIVQGESSGEGVQRLAGDIKNLFGQKPEEG